MADTVLMPQAGQSMTEGKIVQWFVKEGDSVRPGDPVLEIETDKANMDVESTSEGVVRKILHAEGETVPVLVPVAVIGAEDEEIDIDALVASQQPEASAASAPEPAPEPPAPAPAPEAPKASAAPAPVASVPVATVSGNGNGNGRRRVSPLARRVASDRGIDLAALSGTGPRGRILRRDVEAAAVQAPAAAPLAAPMASPLAAPAPAATAEAYPAPRPRPAAVVPIAGIRKAIAAGLQMSKQQAPHFYVAMEVDVTEAEAHRQSLKARGEKVSLNDLVVHACSVALTDDPRVNCRVFEDRVEYPADVNIGIAVGLDDGLVVPVLQRAGEKNLRGIAEENRRIIAAARDGKLVGSGKGTFTISNLGMFGVESFSAVINPPEGAILAVGAAKPRLVPMGGGFFPRTILKLTLSADHRAIDGVVAAEFLARLRHLLEHPTRLI